MNNIAFAFHPSFFRRLWFSHNESEEFMETFGYGYPSSDSKHIEGFTKEITGKGIILPAMSTTDNGRFTEKQIKKINL